MHEKRIIITMINLLASWLWLGFFWLQENFNLFMDFYFCEAAANFFDKLFSLFSRKFFNWKKF